MTTETTDILNHLLVIHHRSLPNYLTHAPPCWVNRAGKEAALLAKIVADQDKLTNRLVAMVRDQGGEPDLGHFPIRFAAFHDLSSSYMAQVLVQYQKRTIAAIEQLSQLLPNSSLAHALAGESLRMANSHLLSMQDLGS